MKRVVELIYDQDCPNVDGARAQLDLAFSQIGIDPQWSEWARDAVDAPNYVLGYGSPTILVNGKDVAGAQESSGASSCRLYYLADGSISGVPSIDDIARALTGRQDDCLEHSATGYVRGRWRGLLATMPAVGSALLPVGVCPACWPAYAAILSALGLGFLMDGAYLHWLVGLLLLVALGAMAWRAKTRWGYGPFALGMFAAILLFAGKFIMVSVGVSFIGAGLLLAASIWNFWPPRRSLKCNC